MRIMRRRRPQPGNGRTSLKRSTRANRHRVTLTADPKERYRSNREGPRHARQGPRTITANVQLYLTAWTRGLRRMRGPLVGFGVRVNPSRTY